MPLLGLAGGVSSADSAGVVGSSVYDDPEGGSLLEIILGRISQDPFNLVATLIFFAAVIHTFFTARFNALAHHFEQVHREAILKSGRTADQKPYIDAKDDVSFRATLFHFLGEVEAIFGIWCIPLVISMALFYDWGAVVSYFSSGVNYTEPVFVVIIMAIASTRPVLFFAEQCLSKVAFLGGHSPLAWWFAILCIAPILGSFITEPAAMTIAALLLGRQFYKLEPSNRLRYATLGLLFVNISVGGTLTHFAAPPVLMVASTWGWDLFYMLQHFGWKACIGIFISTCAYAIIFRKDLIELNTRARKIEEDRAKLGTVVLSEEPIPHWVTVVHLGFLAWTVFTLHQPPLFIGGFLFFMAFIKATAHHQYDLKITKPLLVGFFLAGLVTHGGMQAWWLDPVLSRLGETPLFIGSIVLTAFNDNAAITYLASLVPAFDSNVVLQQAVVYGAVVGGGLTVIANAPNPAGQSILSQYFKKGISPMGLLVSALCPTVIMALCFYFSPY
ncbi:MAG: putative Na+/H+ antiporter [Opitutales bacterium]|tara:strand:+ start:1114 stop:2616 length:1503 start_codon:yes stop_codon:yes gene_type:complete